MHPQGTCFAATEGFGQVYECGHCGNIHVQVGPVSITLDQAAYMQFVTMLNTSAANFEAWVQSRQGHAEGGAA